MNKLAILWNTKEGKRLVLSIILAAVGALILITLATLIALLENIALGYRLLMIAPCIIYIAVVGQLLYKEIVNYKKPKDIL